jgi:hypothetical protein
LRSVLHLENSEVENVNRDHINYPEPKDKAARILVLIINRPKFSRKELGKTFKEAGSLADDLQKGTFYHKP